MSSLKFSFGCVLQNMKRGQFYFSVLPLMFQISTHFFAEVPQLRDKKESVHILDKPIRIFKTQSAAGTWLLCEYFSRSSTDTLYTRL